MVTFDNEDLFESGTARFQIGPIRLRHTIKYTLGSIGGQLNSQGTEVREINQSGELIADDALKLQARVDAIRNKLDGLSHTLVDNLGRIWSDTVMIEVQAEVFTRVGMRVKTAYRIEYLQVAP